MQTIFWALVQNTLLALVPAALAVLASYMRRPALAHLLWALVLLKLVTPPLWQVPVLPTAPSLAQVASTPVRIQGVDLTAVAAEPFQASTPEDAPGVAVNTPPQPAGLPEESLAAGRFTSSGIKPLFLLLTSVWIIGSCVLGLITFRRIVRFRRLLRDTQPASRAIELDLRGLGDRFGLARLPVVRLGPAGISPLIWFIGGRPMLLLPSNLFETLTVPQREAILAHELAHLKRGDHWMRLVEMAITLLLWWHPLVWAARQGLRAAEEQACDVWVVWLTRDTHSYANALVEILNVSVTPLPANVSGLGELGSLKRRLAMILEARPGKTPSRWGWALAVVGALVLPMMPVHGQARQGPPSPPAAPPTLISSTYVSAPAPEPVADEITTAAVKALLEMAVQANKGLTDALPGSGRGSRGGRSGGSPNGGGLGGGGGGGGFGPTPEANAAYTALRSIRIMGAKAEPALKDSLNNSDPGIRAMAVQVLGQIHGTSKTQATLSAVVAALKDPDKQVRANAAMAIAYYRDQSGPATTALLPALEDKEPAVRVAAIESLREIQADPKVATPALTKSLKDEDVRVRQMAAEVIGLLNVPPAPQAKSDPAKGDELFQRVNDDLNTMLPKDADPITISKLNRGTEYSIWEAEGTTQVEGDVQELIANMKASSKFGATKLVSLAVKDGSYTFKLQFTYIESLGAAAPQSARTASDLAALADLSTQIKTRGADAALANLKVAIDTFQVDNARFPATGEGLAALVTAPKGLEGTWHQVLKALPKDPWGHDYLYKAPGAKSDYDLYSAGPDGKPNTADDIIAGKPTSQSPAPSNAAGAAVAPGRLLLRVKGGPPPAASFVGPVSDVVALLPKDVTEATLLKAKGNTVYLEGRATTRESVDALAKKLSSDDRFTGVILQNLARGIPSGLFSFTIQFQTEKVTFDWNPPPAPKVPAEQLP